ncbi:TetR/AcrR family transcriptional regulator [Burkholderia sp. Bp8963]|uniref:TetR/AcrR family transcriptional regulator n=1 Tax=Burkholderia sp. Bp8963 TaxID=2184547 RepID=UPI000F59C115|nr:TetR/AcrR family transcriptional regulator [Burkholderia sp. Bp8963]RQS65996.1 TetR/AcrR family transcriptional regulator [Burkholderia sp. Bp8963]
MDEVSERSPAKRRARGRPLPGASVGPDVILRAARGMFAKRGYDATSVREIARELDVDAALIAHHFGSKETLWLAVVEQIAELAAPLFDAQRALRTSSLSRRARVERALELGIDMVFAEPDIGMFFSTATTEQGERLNRLLERLVRPYHAVMVPLLTDAAEAGEITMTDPDVMFFMLENAIGTTVAYSHLMHEFTSLPTRPQQFKEAVLATAINLLGR